jgi:hypothetical protein
VIQFNDLLNSVGISPTEVRLLRHHTAKPGKNGKTLCELWRNDRSGFELYQSTQDPNQPMFRTGSVWAAFVSPAPGETMFVGLYDISYKDTRRVEWDCPYRGGKPGNGESVDIFHTRLRSELSEHIERLYIGWNGRAWRRYSEKAPFPVVGELSLSPRPAILSGQFLADALGDLGFSQRHATKKVLQYRRDELVVYLKRETETQPLIVHPRFIDIASEMLLLDGIDIAWPPRPYINSNLTEFPAYAAADQRSTGRNGFALGVPTQSLAALVGLLEKRSVVETDVGLIRVVAPQNAPLTQYERIQAARIGQGDFRTALIAAWNSTCPVVGVDHPELLRASHIKPWRDSTDAERLDPFNGLLLCAHIDALFDRGFISFENDGRILISRIVTQANLNRLKLNPDMVISGLDERHVPYLDHHRRNCFVR